MRKKIHNFVLKALVTLATFGVVTSGSMLDSDSLLPAIICGVCLAFIGLFVYANREEIGRS